MGQLRAFEGRVDGVLVSDYGFGLVDQAAVEASWAHSREVGRHWLTEHDFPVLGASR